MLSALLLVIALCVDAFATSITYGIGKISIPFSSALVISFIGTTFLGVSLLFAKIIQQFISADTCLILSVGLLLFIGVTSLFQSTIKSYLRKHKGQKNVKFSLFDISFVVDIFIDETKADADNSKVLSAKEAIMLAFALSIDSLATGFSAGLAVNNVLGILILCFVMGIFSVKLGCLIGERISKKSKVDLSWTSGFILIVLALQKFI